MSSIIDTATAILASSERRVELHAHNVANLSTPGFKSRVAFAELLGDASAERAQWSFTADRAPGPMARTGNPLDLSIVGDGWLALDVDGSAYLSRGGQFSLDSDGIVRNEAGHALLDDSGTPLMLERADGATIADDGTIVLDGIAVARIGLFSAPQMVDTDQGSLIPISGALEPARDASVRQGVIEGSNVELSGQMVAMMAARREMESGARLVQLWDQLIGRGLSTFGGRS